MKIYNTLTGKKQEFIPLEEGKVKMYACGITVSGEAHIGHAYQALIYDIIRKYFEKKEYMCVADPDAFLRSDYGNYMQLPPEEERTWKHHPIIIDFEHNYEELNR